MELLSARAIDGRDGVVFELCSTGSPSSGIAEDDAIEFAVNFLSVLCEAASLSSGVVGVEDGNSDEAEWNVVSDAVEAESGCGWTAVVICSCVGDDERDRTGDTELCNESRLCLFWRRVNQGCVRIWAMVSRLVGST